MEEKLDLILNKLERLEKNLLDVKEETILDFLNDNDKKYFIGVNINVVYEAYKNVTEGNASRREFNDAVKKIYGLRVKHTTKDKKNIYYWSE